MDSHQHEYVFYLRKIVPDFPEEEVRKKGFVLKESIDQLCRLKKGFAGRLLHELDEAIASSAAIKHAIL